MSVLRKAWQVWKRIGEAIGNFIARIVLTLFYFTIFLPFGLGVRLFGDRLDMKGKGPPSWLERHTSDLEMDGARRLF